MCKVTCATFILVNSFTGNKKNKILVPPYQQSNSKHWKSNRSHVHIYLHTCNGLLLYKYLI